MTLDEKVAQLETVWEQKAKLQTADGDFSNALASKNFPNGIGGFARPSDYRGVTQSNGAAGASGETVNRDAAPDRGICQCRAALGASSIRASESRS